MLTTGAAGGLVQDSQVTSMENGKQGTNIGSKASFNIFLFRTTTFSSSLLMSNHC